MQNYIYGGHYLYRRVYDFNRQEHVERVVIPSGGLKSLWHNGRKRSLTLRRRLLLEHHDEEASGAHSNARDTAAKLSEFCWWPSLDADAHANQEHIMSRRQVRKLLNVFITKLPSEGAEHANKDVRRINPGSCNLEPYKGRTETNTTGQTLLQKRQGQVHCPISW